MFPNKASHQSMRPRANVIIDRNCVHLSTCFQTFKMCQEMCISDALESFWKNLDRALDNPIFALKRFLLYGIWPQRYQMKAEGLFFKWQFSSLLQPPCFVSLSLSSKHQIFSAYSIISQSLYSMISIKEISLV